MLIMANVFGPLCTYFVKFSWTQDDFCNNRF